MAWIGRLVTLLAAVAVAGLVYAQSAPDKAAKKASTAAKRDTKAKAAIAVTPEREAAVMTFVLRNHSELADLLTYLKTSQPAEYERAVREIFRTTERLANIQERDPVQYELEVAFWTAQSHVQLVSAKIKMGASEELINQLRAALNDQADARLALLKHERQKVVERLARMDRDISQLENNRQAVIEMQLALLTGAAESGAAKGKSGSKPAKKTQ